MASRIFRFSVFIYIVKVAYTFPHNIGHNNFASLPNVYNNNGLNHRNIGTNLGTTNIGHNVATGANIGRNVAASSLASAKGNLAGSRQLNNNRVTTSGLNHIDLGQFAKRPNANQLASNILGTSSAGSLSTSSASAQSLASDITSRRQHNRVTSPTSLGAVNNMYDDVGATTAASSSVALDDVEFSPIDECPDNMEMIGYVTFEGFLPVQGSVKVAESIGDCPV